MDQGPGTPLPRRRVPHIVITNDEPEPMDIDETWREDPSVPIPGFMPIADFPPELIDKFIEIPGWINSLTGPGGLRAADAKIMREGFLWRKLGRISPLIEPTLLQIPQVLAMYNEPPTKRRIAPSLGRARLWSWEEMTFILPLAVRFMALRLAVLIRPTLSQFIDGYEHVGDYHANSQRVKMTNRPLTMKNLPLLTYERAGFTRIQTRDLVLENGIDIIFNDPQHPDVPNHIDDLMLDFETIPEKGDSFRRGLMWSDPFGVHHDLGIELEFNSWTTPDEFANTISLFIVDIVAVARYMNVNSSIPPEVILGSAHESTRKAINYLANNNYDWRSTREVILREMDDNGVRREMSKTRANNILFIASFISRNDNHWREILSFLLSLLLEDKSAAELALIRLSNYYPQLVHGEFHHVLFNHKVNEFT